MLASPWRIQLLGGLAVQNTHQTITRFRTHHTGALLAYLAYYSQRSHPREELVALLWPNAESEAGRVSLRTALASLRRQLEAPGVRTEAVLVADRTNVQLRPEAIRTDVADFDDARRAALRAQDSAQQSETLARAVAAYGGPLLPGYYNDWMLTERQRLASAYQETLSQLAVLLQQGGHTEQALDYARRVVTLDPLNEESHCLLMRLYAAGRKRDALLRQYALLEKTLRVEMDIEPSLETQALLRQLQQPGAEGIPLPLTMPVSADRSGLSISASIDAPTSLPSRGTAVSEKTATLLKSSLHSTREIDQMVASASFAPSSALVRLPLLFTRFFGRERERAQLTTQLREAFPRSEDPAHDAFAPRLLTLTGPGGMGKTRLAVEVGRGIAAQQGIQTVLVELADTQRAEHILPTIATTLHLPSANEEAVQAQVIQALRAAPTLLILDNFEQLLEEEPTTAGSDTANSEEAVRVVQDLCLQVNSLVCLITSRQRLNLPGEEEFPLAPLPMPDEADTIPILLENPSVRLFLDRARAVRPDFQITLSNSHDIAALSQALEGIPLAIELLAVWVQTLSPAQMRQRLSERMNLLQSRQRGVRPRHSGLRACIEWSYRLLSADLQPFFAQLSVFRGGWSLEAAEAVCAAPQALELLTSLRERSLLVVEEIEVQNGAGAQAEFPVVTMRYRLLETLRVYAEEQLTPDLRAACEKRHLDYFARLTDQAREHLSGAEQATWLATLSREYDNIRTAFARCAATPESQQTALRMCVNLGRFWENRGDYREGMAKYILLLAMPDVQKPTHFRALAYNGAGNLAYHQRDNLTAREYYTQSLALSRALDDKPTMAIALSNLGNIASDQGDFPQARLLYTESLQLKRETGSSPANEAHTLTNLGNVHFREQDYAGAHALYQLALALQESVGNGSGILVVLTSLAATARKEDALQEAFRHYQEALRLCREVGEKLFTAICLEGMAYMASTLPRDSTSVQLYSAAAALRERIRSPIDTAAALDRDRTLETLRAKLGETFESAWQRGRDMTTEQAIDAALQLENRRGSEE